MLGVCKNQKHDYYFYHGRRYFFSSGPELGGGLHLEKYRVLSNIYGPLADP